MLFSNSVNVSNVFGKFPLFSLQDDICNILYRFKLDNNLTIQVMLSHPNYGNMSLYEVKSDAVRHAWILYYLVVILSSLIGDTIILIASTKYSALKLHHFIITLMQHIAVCDLAVCTFWVLPRFLSLITNRWILGEKLCTVQPYVMYYFGTACLLLTCAMAVCKLSILKFPIRSRCLTAEKAHQVCAAVWVVSSNVPITFLDQVEVHFDFRSYSCDFYTFSKSSLLISTGLNLLIPNIFIVGSTGLIVMHLFKARRASRRIGGIQRWQGILATILTAAVYTISVLPFTVYCFTVSLSEDNHTTDCNDIENIFHYRYYRFATAIVLLNIFANFFIHSLTVGSFRRFLASIMQRLENFVFTIDPETLTTL
jgi:hypothetical protein